MRLETLKYCLLALLLFGLGLLIGTGLSSMYSSHIRRRHAFPAGMVAEDNKEDVRDRVEEQDGTKKIPGLNLTSYITGPEAEEIVYGFMGRERELKDASISTYKNFDEQVTVFVAEYSSSLDVEEIISFMEKCLKEKEIFSKFKIINLFDSIPVNYGEEEGVAHSFYVKDHKIFWLTIEAGDNLALLEKIYLHY